jgi:hypothetical protein
MEGLGSIPGKGKISLFSTKSRRILGYNQPPIQRGLGRGVLSARVKREGHETDNSRKVRLYLHSLRIHGTVLNYSSTKQLYLLLSSVLETVEITLR